MNRVEDAGKVWFLSRCREEPHEHKTDGKNMTTPWIEGRFEENVITTSLEQAMNWARQSSIWPMTFGLACCAIEMMAAGASRFELVVGHYIEGQMEAPSQLILPLLG